ncbi:hypothetical protein D9757_003889 [Collybiopsis confluens]|uniref:B-related factor 1 n=1 Tax=Collybiopsis confluens TaxID=2823264 RepID=A0A8H5HV83_9AGAR|nr:hypothetical protein D9757_003889 [Collybiopsis confluens]
MPSCTDCGGTVIEYDAAAGNGFCVLCGTVVEENTIVNEVAFGETSTGAAMVQGSYVAQGATHARMSGPFGNRGNTESREQTIANATRKIQNIAGILRLSEQVCLSATRLYTLAVEHKFTKGRKSMNVVAVCLYVACRQKETRNYMLIDFSDLLQVNVFELGHTYLQLVQTLNLRLPLVDPSHYISRFAALLEFGDETHRVATDAIRLVQRFDRDWMTRGRRPAGICGAALLLAARMNNFRRSVEEIVQVVKIADTTLKKRLDEFKNTPSGALTLADFRSVWLEDEMDPPAFTKGREKEEAERLAKEQEALGVETPEGEAKKKKSSSKGKKGKEKARKRKRKRAEDDEGSNEDAEADVDREVTVEPLQEKDNEQQGQQGQQRDQRPTLDPALMTQGILAGTIQPPLFLPETADGSEVPDSNIEPMLFERGHDVPSSSMRGDLGPSGSGEDATLVAPPLDAYEQVIDSALAEEVATFLINNQGSMLTEALNDADQQRRAQMQANVDEELLGLDEEELNRFLLTEEEVKIKERVWVELNRDYLEALAAKGDQTSAKETKARKRRKTTSTKPRDTTTPHGTTPAESVRNLIKKNPKYSKRINYDALKDLFIDSNDKDEDAGVDAFNVNGTATDHMDVNDAELYTMDDRDAKDDTELVVIEDNDDNPPPPPPLPPPEEDEEDDGYGDGDGDGDDAMLDNGTWDEPYQQEV